jgi:hypothetical protein
VTRNGSLNVVTGAGTLVTGLSGTGVPIAQSGTLTTPLNFGSVSNPSTSTMTATLTNTSTIPLTVDVPSSSVSGLDFSFVSTTCGTSLAVGATCTTIVKFAPSLPVGARSGTLNVVTGTGPLVSNLSGSSVSGTTSATLTSPLAFGTHDVNSTTALNATVTNTGSLALSINVAGTAITGADFGIVGNNCPTSLGAGLTCAITVTFTPSAPAGGRSGTLTVPTTGAGTLTAALSGTGVSPGAATLTPSVNFNSVTVGQTSSASAVLSNTGGSAFTVNSVSVAGAGFSLGNSCPASIGAGNSCAIVVNFSPTAATTYSGTLTASTSVGTLTSTLSGTGVPQQSGSLASLDFGGVTPGSPKTLAAILTNTGSVLLNITTSSIAVTGAEFSFSSTDCPSGLAVNRSCNINVTFSPSVANTTRTGSLSVQTGAGPLSSSLIGGNGPNVSISPTNADAGNQLEGVTVTGTFTVSNAGTSGSFSKGLVINGPNQGDFRIGNSTCPADGTIVGAGNCTIDVTFTGHAQCGGLPSSLSATLTVAVGNSSATARLSGQNHVYPLTDPLCQ